MAFDIPQLSQNVVDLAWNFAESIVVAMTHKSVVPGTYVPANGVDPQSVVSTEVGVIPLTFKSEEIDGKLVKSGDKKILVRASELPTMPKQDDYFMEGSVRWDVTGYVVPTTDKLWKVGVRRHQT
jgi:hypothetical protein